MMSDRKWTRLRLMMILNSENGNLELCDTGPAGS